MNAFVLFAVAFNQYLWPFLPADVQGKYPLSPPSSEELAMYSRLEDLTRLFVKTRMGAPMSKARSFFEALAAGKLSGWRSPITAGELFALLEMFVSDNPGLFEEAYTHLAAERAA